MKVVHVLKRIELIDADIRDLKKLEKSIASNKSFSTPLYMSIEKQINLLLAERIKMFELSIANPPATLVELVEGKLDKDDVPVLNAKKGGSPKNGSSKPKVPAKPTSTKKAPQKVSKIGKGTDDDDDMSMLTQDIIDAKFSKVKEVKEDKSKKPKPEDYKNDNSIKLIDIALEKGTLSKREIDKEKKIRFFRENFPVD
jgi:hypothetical protein